MRAIMKLFIILSFVLPQVVLAAKATLEIGVLPFGTLSWELAVLETEKLDEANNFKLKQRTVATAQASKIALQSNAVDMIVSDWIWVNRQRQNGFDFTFYPYSNTAGVLIVPADSNIRSLVDLKGKKLGIAGGELDKNWIMLKAVAEKRDGIQLDSDVIKVFGAPPLLNQQLLQGRIDALINYWHYGVRLEAKGYRQLLDGHSLLKELDIQEAVPPLGFVFKEKWANGNRETLRSFLKASRQAKNLICGDDSVWRKVIPLIQSPDLETTVLLRKRYCGGLVNQWGEQEREAAGKVFSVLRQYGGRELTDDSDQLKSGTFWRDKDRVNSAKD